MSVKSWLYIDADNQSPALAPSTIRFLENIGRPAQCAVIAGNGAGRGVKDWETALRDIAPEVDILPRIAPMRKQSADAILLFEMAQLYHQSTSDRPLIVILSRDDLLVAAAELLAARDHAVLVALGPGMPVPATTVPVVVLPVQAPQAPLPTFDASTIEAASADSTLPDATVLRTAARAICHHLGTQDPNTGYPASAVGQVLANLGHDKATRTRILGAIAEVKTDHAGVRRVWLTAEPETFNPSTGP